VLGMLGLSVVAGHSTPQAVAHEAGCGRSPHHPTSRGSWQCWGGGRWCQSLLSAQRFVSKENEMRKEKKYLQPKRHLLGCSFFLLSSSSSPPRPGGPCRSAPAAPRCHPVSSCSQQWQLGVLSWCVPRHWLSPPPLLSFVVLLLIVVVPTPFPIVPLLSASVLSLCPSLPPSSLASHRHLSLFSSFLF
jgi:hypothetical protein